MCRVYVCAPVCVRPRGFAHVRALRLLNDTYDRFSKRYHDHGNLHFNILFYLNRDL